MADEEVEHDPYEYFYATEREVIDEVYAEDTPSSVTILEYVAVIRERMAQLSAAEPSLECPPLDPRVLAKFPRDTDLITLIIGELTTPEVEFPIMIRRGHMMYKIGKPPKPDYLTQFGYFARPAPQPPGTLALDWRILDMRVGTTIEGDSSFETVIRDMQKYGNVGSRQLLAGAKKYLETRQDCATARGLLGALA